MKRIVLALVLVISSTKALAAEGDTWNLRFNPVVIIVGMLIGEVDYKINDHLAVGPSFLNWNFTINDFSASASGFGVQGAYHINPLYTDGVYLGGFFNTLSISASAKDLSGNRLTSSASGTQIGVKAGYHWFWDSFNLNLGFKVGANSVAKIQVKDAAGNVVDEQSGPGGTSDLDFAIGFTF